MEGVGSRLGRASSRYGPPAAATVFSGPVRKWKKKWVHVSSNHHHHNNNNNNNSSHSQSNGHNSSSSRLLLRRWTPLASAASTTAAADASSEEPPKRRFRYTPIVVVEEQRKAAEKLEQEAKTNEANHLNAWKTFKKDELNSGEDLKKDTQQTTHLDLGLYLEGGNSDHDSVSRSKVSQMEKANSGGFWTG